MGQTADQSTSGSRWTASVLKLLVFRIGLPIAISAVIALAFMFGFGLNFDESFMPIVIGFTPFIASFACGASFGHDLYANGWRRMLLPLLGFLALISLLYVPFSIFDFVRAKTMLVSLPFTFAGVALVGYLFAFNREWQEFLRSRSPWAYRRSPGK